LPTPPARLELNHEDEVLVLLRADELRPSRPRWYDVLAWMLFRREPYRCSICRCRQWQRVRA